MSIVGLDRSLGALGGDDEDVPGDGLDGPALLPGELLRVVLLHQVHEPEGLWNVVIISLN